MNTTRGIQRVIAVLCLCVAWVSVQAEGLTKAAKLRKSVVTVTTYDAAGKELGHGQGFYLDANGKAVAAYHLFKGASKANVTDADGKSYEVATLTGANDLYDVITFRVSGVKKTPLLTVAREEAVAGATAYVLAETAGKGGVPTGTVQKIDRCGGDDTAPYYTLALANPDGVAGATGSPVFNAQEEVIGVFQEPVKRSDSKGYVLGLAYCNALTTNAFSATSQPFSAVHIPVALPADQSQAESLLYLVAGTQPLDTVLYVHYLNQMVEQFPNVPSGYLSRATYYAVKGDRSAADKDMSSALKVSKTEDETRYECAKIYYAHALEHPEDSLTQWSFNGTIEACDRAYAKNPVALYRTLKGNALYAKRDYAAAYETYRALCDGADATPELWFYAMQAKKMQNGTVAEQLELADSAMNCFTKPYRKEAAPYLWVRAGLHKQAEQYREAVNDYTEYEHLNYASLGARFYYERMEAEVNCRMYQQAVDDITKAVELEPEVPDYRLEKATLELRLNLYDEAIATCDAYNQRWTDNPDIYRIKGVSLCLQGKKAAGCAEFEKARALGDDSVDVLVEKYGK